MDTCLYQGDHLKDKRGIPFSIDGTAQKAQEALIRLSIPKGSFMLNPSLGSYLHTLSPSLGASLNDTALRYAQEALYDMDRVQVKKAVCSFPFGDTLSLALSLQIDSQSQTLSLSF